MEKTKFLFIVIFILLNSNIPCNALSYVCDKNSVPCGCGQKNVETNAQAVYGENSVPYSWPMIVSLRRYDTHLRHICTGTILSESYILITANCIHRYTTGEAFKNLTIVADVYNVSQTNGIIRKIDKIIIHPLWGKLGSEYQYDIAILRLSEPLDLTANSSLARTCLPSQQNISEDNLNYPSNGTRLFNVGWGVSDKSDGATLSLQQMAFLSIDHIDKICSKTIRNPTVQFCAGFFKCDKDGCYGNPVGAIFQWITDRWEQVGIASYVEIGPGSNGSAVVFTRLSYFHDWIQRHINNHTDNQAIEKQNLYKCNNAEKCGCSRRNVVLSSSITVENENALPHSWSMIVSISLHSTNQHLCSGTILGNSFVLTAAHCVKYRSASNLIIKAGMYALSENDIIIRHVNEIFIHPNFTEQSNQYKNDLAIIRLSTPLGAYYDNNITRSCLSPNNNEETGNTLPLSNGIQLVVTGWNITDKVKPDNSLILQQAEIYSMDNCSVSSDQKKLQFCAGQYRKDQQDIILDKCYGGSFGDPVFQWIYNRWIQIGVASYCGINNKLGVFTYLTKYQDWIKSTLITSIIQTSQIYPCDQKATCGCGQANVNVTTEGVINSENAVENSWSMIVSIQWSGRHLCAGSIISDSLILTSAACASSFINLKNLIKIVAGISNLKDTATIYRNIDQIYIHPDYSNTNLHDLAIIRLDQSLPFNSNQAKISKACLSLENQTYPALNTSLVILGWDDSLSQIENKYRLQQMSVRPVDVMHITCLRRFIDKDSQFCAIPANDDEFIKLTSFCTTVKGGPVMMYVNNHWELVGLMTDRFECLTDRVGIFTRLSPYHKWIKQIPQLPNSSFTTYPISIHVIIIAVIFVIIKKKSVLVHN